MVKELKSQPSKKTNGKEFMKTVTKAIIGMKLRTGKAISNDEKPSRLSKNQINRSLIKIF